MSGFSRAEPLVTDPELAARVRGGQRPHFLLIGAAKSGTSSLWTYLQQHPEVFLPQVKEPNYFAFGPAGPSLAGPAAPDVLAARLYSRTVTDPHAYLDLFSSVDPGVVGGEASVRYLYDPDAPARIAAALPDARLVAVLRHPVDRLKSHYEMNVAAGLEPLSLEDALASEDERVAAGWGWDWHYTRVGRYADQVARYCSAWEEGRLLVLEYAEFRDRPGEAYAQVCRHLGVDPGFVPDMSRRSKESYQSRSRIVERAVSHPAVSALGRRVAGRGGWTSTARRVVRSVNKAPARPVDDRLRAQLGERFAGDVSRLEDMVGRELPSLRSPS